MTRRVPGGRSRSESRGLFFPTDFRFRIFVTAHLRRPLVRSRGRTHILAWRSTRRRPVDIPDIYAGAWLIVDVPLIVKARARGPAAAATGPPGRLRRVERKGEEMRWVEEVADQAAMAQDPREVGEADAVQQEHSHEDEVEDALPGFNAAASVVRGLDKRLE